MRRCRILNVTRQKQPIKHDYFKNGMTLQTVDHHKHCGVTVSAILSWDQHTSSICAKAKRIMEFIMRSFGYKSSAAVETALKFLSDHH